MNKLIKIRNKYKIPSSFVCDYPVIDGVGTLVQYENQLKLIWTRDLEKKGEEAVVAEF